MCSDNSIILTIHAKEIKQSFGAIALSNTEKKLFAIFIVFNVLGDIAPLQFFPEVTQSTLLSPRVFIELFKNKLQQKTKPIS